VTYNSCRTTAILFNQITDTGHMLIYSTINANPKPNPTNRFWVLKTLNPVQTILSFNTPGPIHLHQFDTSDTHKCMCTLYTDNRPTYSCEVLSACLSIGPRYNAKCKCITTSNGEKYYGLIPYDILEYTSMQPTIPHVQSVTPRVARTRFIDHLIVSLANTSENVIQLLNEIFTQSAL